MFLRWIPRYGFLLLDFVSQVKEEERQRKCTERELQAVRDVSTMKQNGRAGTMTGPLFLFRTDGTRCRFGKFPLRKYGVLRAAEGNLRLDLPPFERASREGTRSQWNV